MKPILKQVLVPAISAVVGGLIVFLGGLILIPSLQSTIVNGAFPEQNHEAKWKDLLEKNQKMKDPFDSLFERKLFPQNDPFDFFMNDQLGSDVIRNISKREDDDSVYFDIQVEDMNSTSINTKVENGYITITGTTEKKTDSTDDEDSQSLFGHQIFKSTFNKTFPLPLQVDQSKMQMLTEKDKIILKFPKLKET